MKAKEVYSAVKALPKDCTPSAKAQFFATNNGCDLVHANIPLTDTITPLISHVFSNGQCHALALALHDILGWPIMGTYHQFGGSRHTNHYVLLSPEGFSSDIEGIRCIDWGLRKVKIDTIRAGRIRYCLPMANDLASHYAPMIAEALIEQRKPYGIRAKWPFPGSCYSE